MSVEILLGVSNAICPNIVPASVVDSDAVAELQDKQLLECALANKATLVKLDVLESFLALAVGGGGGVPSVPVRSQVPSSESLSHRDLHSTPCLTCHVPH